MPGPGGGLATGGPRKGFAIALASLAFATSKDEVELPSVALGVRRITSGCTPRRNEELST